MSPLHWRLLTKTQEETFHRLKIFRQEAVLAGGTALALQIGHRYSYDFDLFFPRRLTRRDLEALRRTIRIQTVALNTEELLQVSSRAGVRIHCVYYPFPPLSAPVPTVAVPLAAVKDIAADKAHTVGRRAAWRDYVDLFFLFRQGYCTGESVVRWAKKKFHEEFSERIFLEQLGYFGDLEPVKISFVKESFTPKEIQAFLQREAQRLVP